MPTSSTIIINVVVIFVIIVINVISVIRNVTVIADRATNITVLVYCFYDTSNINIAHSTAFSNV